MKGIKMSTKVMNDLAKQLTKLSSAKKPNKAQIKNITKLLKSAGKGELQKIMKTLDPKTMRSLIRNETIRQVAPQIVGAFATDITGDIGVKGAEIAYGDKGSTGKPDQSSGSSGKSPEEDLINGGAESTGNQREDDSVWL